MRQYRGIPIDGKDFVYGWLFYTITSRPYIIEPHNGIVALMYPNVGGITISPTYIHKVIPETVGQSTSLKDKNGKGDEVYQNDIVSSFNGVKYLVYWDAEYGQWWARIVNKTKGKYTQPLCSILDNSYMHIIGNIHQKELIEGKDNG